MKILKKILKTVLTLLILGLAALALVYFSRFQTMATIRKLSDCADGYDIYSMTVKYDYSVEDVIRCGIGDTQSFVDAVLRESLPILPIHMKLPAYGCSTYRAVTEEGDVIMGRNYDFKLDTSCMLLYCEPKNGYRSMAFAALNNVQADQADKNLRTKMACLTAPFSCLDGINEKGVSIAVLTLDSEPTDQKNGRDKITSSLGIRLVLDGAATTAEAVDILSRYDMYAVNGRDYHFFISDATGDSRVVEYDPEDPARPLVDTKIQAVTNFYGMYIDKVKSGQRNGIYGHGKERYDHIMNVITANYGVLDRTAAWAALKAAATEPNPENVTSNTQWSIIFNNTDLTADIVLRRKWDAVYSFSLK